MKYTLTVRACYLGYITQAIVNNLSPLLFLIFKEELGIPIFGITLLITVNFLVQLAVDFLSAKFADKIGCRTCIAAAHIFCAAGLISMGVLPRLTQSAYPALLFSAVLCAVGGGLIEVLISPILDACPADDKASAMSLLHSFYCWGTVAVVLLSTLFLKFFGSGSWVFLSALWALLPLLNALFFSRVPLAPLLDEEKGMNVKSLFTNGTFWVFFLLMLFSGASEQAMSQWASSFAEGALHLSKTVGDIFGICLFALLMGLSRAFYGIFGEKIDLTRFLRLSAVLCAASYLIASLAQSPLLSLAGCALCGLSVGIMWPGTFSSASFALPKGGTPLFALLALSGDLGCALGPSLVGVISSRFGDDLKKGLLAAALFPLLLFAVSFFAGKKRA